MTVLIKKKPIRKTNPLQVFLICTVLGYGVTSYAQNSNVASSKQRIVVTTDIGGTDPDDEQSMVHLLLCSNDLDIEGLVCQMAFCPSPIGIDVLKNIIGAYRKAYPNLIVHSDHYPTPDYLMSIATTGQTEVGMQGVGKSKDTPGSNLIVETICRPDPRPIWLVAWGGMNTIAQALWKIKTVNPNADLSNIHIYDILGQCDAGAWIAKNYPDIPYIRAREVYGWTPDAEWTKANIQAYGQMGAVYPDSKWATEGDSPSFMFLIDNGLNLPKMPTAGGWGGRFNAHKSQNIRGMEWVVRNNMDETQYYPYYMYTNPEGIQTIKPWSTHIRNDFAARIQWSCTSKYSDANHHPIIQLNDELISSRLPIIVNAQPNETIFLNVNHSDPDGDATILKTYVMKECSDHIGNIDLAIADSRLIIKVPADATQGSCHIIIEATDNGKPSLTAYRRLIINVSSK